jgi:hypothetical protein
MTKQKKLDSVYLNIANEISRLYDAEELYLELTKLCNECATSKKNCKCGKR